MQQWTCTHGRSSLQGSMQYNRSRRPLVHSSQAASHSSSSKWSSGTSSCRGAAL